MTLLDALAEAWKRAQVALARGRALGIMPEAGETVDAFTARLDALTGRADAAPGPSVARWG